MNADDQNFLTNEFQMIYLANSCLERNRLSSQLHYAAQAGLEFSIHLRITLDFRPSCLLVPPRLESQGYATTPSLCNDRVRPRASCMLGKHLTHLTCLHPCELPPYLYCFPTSNSCAWSIPHLPAQ